MVVGFASSPTLSQQRTVAVCEHKSEALERVETGAACSAILADPKATRENRVKAYLVRGIWHYKAWRMAEATDDIDKGLALEPRHAHLLTMRAWLHLAENEIEEAERVAKRSVQIDPAQPSTFLLLGTIATRTGEGKAALGYYNKAVDLDAGDAMARYGRVSLLIDFARAPEALADTEWLIAQPARIVNRRGQAWVDGRYVKLFLASRLAHVNVLTAMNRYEQAEAFFATIIGEERTAFTLTQRSKFLHNLPFGAGMKNRLPDALADAEAAVRLDPTDSWAQRQYASTLEYAKRPAEAIAAIELAMQQERYPTSIPPMLWERARMLRALGRTQEAIESAQESLLLAQAVAPVYLRARIERLQDLGYWTNPRTEEETVAVLTDAVTACMADEKCW
jgi:tetratricopeptide (TPR) repeat protein